MFTKAATLDPLLININPVHLSLLIVHYHTRNLLTPHLCLRLPSGLSSFKALQVHLLCIYHSSHTCYMSSLVRPAWFDRTTQIIVYVLKSTKYEAFNFSGLLLLFITHIYIFSRCITFPPLTHTTFETNMYTYYSTFNLLCVHTEYERSVCMQNIHTDIESSHNFNTHN